MATPTIAGAGPPPSQEPGAPSRSVLSLAGTLEPSPAAFFLGHLQKAGLEAEQLEYNLAPVWDSQVRDSALPSMPNPGHRSYFS